MIYGQKIDKYIASQTKQDDFLSKMYRT